MGASAQATDDSHSHAVAAAALRALAPAWVASGRSMGDLVGAIVGQLPSVSAHRRSALVEALVGAVGVEEGRSHWGIPGRAADQSRDGWLEQRGTKLFNLLSRRKLLSYENCRSCCTCATTEP